MVQVSSTAPEKRAYHDLSSEERRNFIKNNVRSLFQFPGIDLRGYQRGNSLERR